MYKLRFSKLRPYIYDLVLTDNSIMENRRENPIFYNLFKNHSSIYLETCHDFFLGPKITDFLTIHPEIENKAKVIYNRFESPTYGLHIRGTDNHISRKYSPPGVFKEFVKKKLLQEKNAHFFLATDSKQVEKEFIDEFKERIIISRNDNIDRNSKEGIKNAFVDMICLSRTKKVYGSYYSSFSTISAKLSGIESECVTVGSPDLDDPYL